MRLWFLALLLALAASALWVGSAFADASTYHSKYTATTRACAGCHRAHTAVSDSLLKSTTIYGLCTSCHGSASGLDVVDGVEWQTDSSTHAPYKLSPPMGGTKGGGFENSLMNTTMDATGNPALQPAVLKPSTSAHVVKGMGSYAGDTMWGSGKIGTNTTAGAAATLECTSCHDPHGQSGVDPTTGAKIPTYRLLRSMVNTAKMPDAQATRVNVPEDSEKSHEYVVSSSAPLVLPPATPTPVPAPPYPLATPLPAVYGTYYGQAYDNTSMTALSSWCATCHTRIHTSDATGSPGSTNSTDPIYTFRHSTLGDSVENNYGSTQLWPSGSPGCVTCHTAHGSSAAMSRQAAEVPKPGTAGGVGNYLDSSLLRVDNRGVCELCHNK